MALTIQTDPNPLRADEHGVIRVGDSQVLLDVVVQEFNNGAEPEAIAHGFPTLNLADVYGVIAYYLRHRRDIDAYLQTRRQEAEKLRQEIEDKQPSRADRGFDPMRPFRQDWNVLAPGKLGKGG